MIFSVNETKTIYISRTNPENPLSTFSRHEFELDGSTWPSVEHYYQANKFEDEAIRETIKTADTPEEARKLAKKNKRKIRTNWKKNKITFMTRAVYIKCCHHEDVKRALLNTRTDDIIENSQYDYFWGCGRDLRGANAYGKILMDVRKKISAK